MGKARKEERDISACVTNPVFSANQFYVPISAERLEENPRLHFGSFVVTDRKENAAEFEAKG